MEVLILILKHLNIFQKIIKFEQSLHDVVLFKTALTRLLFAFINIFSGIPDIFKPFTPPCYFRAQHRANYVKCERKSSLRIEILAAKPNLQQSVGSYLHCA